MTTSQMPELANKKAFSSTSMKRLFLCYYKFNPLYPFYEGRRHGMLSHDAFLDIRRN